MYKTEEALGKRERKEGTLGKKERKKGPGIKKCPQEWILSLLFTLISRNFVTLLVLVWRSYSPQGGIYIGLPLGEARDTATVPLN